MARTAKATRESTRKNRDAVVAYQALSLDERASRLRACDGGAHDPEPLAGGGRFCFRCFHWVEKP